MAGFTQLEKEMALEIYRARGATAAAKETGCSRQAIYDWIAEALSTDTTKGAEEAAAVEAKTLFLRAHLRHRLIYAAVRYVDRALEPMTVHVGKEGVPVELSEPTPEAAQKFLTTAAIALDKFRLESGESTSRIYHDGADDVDRSIRQLEAELSRRTDHSTEARKG